MNDTYLITGGTGFIGSNIVRSLLEKKKKVVLLTRNKQLSWRLGGFRKEVDVRVCEIEDPKLVLVVKNINPDYVFHLAAYGVSPAELEMSQMIKTNMQGTVNVVNALKRTNFKLMINAGSAVEYGIKNRPMKETDILNPINDYGVTKAAATIYCQKEAIKNDMPIITFRLFTPFGYLEDKGRLMPLIMKGLIDNDPPSLSSPRSVRDFVFIEDVVDIFIKAAKRKVFPGEIYNIGSGKQHSVREVFYAIQDVSRSAVKPRWGAVPSQSRQIEPKKWIANIGKTKKTFDWELKYNFRDAVEKYWIWFRKNAHYYDQ